MSVRAFISLVVLVILITASSAVDIESDESPRTPMVSDSFQEVEESFVQILGQSRQVLSFARFTHEYGKMYHNEEEIKRRFSVFKENLDLIRSSNNKSSSYKLGVTQFADLTFQEFQMSNSGSAQDSFATLEGSHSLKVTAGSFPIKFDWRAHGVVSRVKNQGLCRASWAFSATGAIEAAYHRKFRVMTELSEQQLIDCSYKPNGPWGCSGGFPFQAFDYLKYNGLTSEKEYPYIGVRGPCRRHTPQSLVVSRSVRMRMHTEDELADLLVFVGPISISFVVREDMLLYSGGIYDNPSCGKFGGVIQYALAVGYGTEGGKNFWVIKNSWGENWGENGYLKLRRGTNMCGILSGEITYPSVA